MLFEVLLDDKNLDERARSQLSRLIVPYVRVAVLDRRLFMQKRDGNKSRKYECPWKAHVEDAQEELDALRATHHELGFRVMVESWNPMTRY